MISNPSRGANIINNLRFFFLIYYAMHAYAIEPSFATSNPKSGPLFDLAWPLSAAHKERALVFAWRLSASQIVRLTSFVHRNV